MAVRVPLLDVGRLTARLDEIIAQHGEPPWSETMMINEDMQAFFIANAPGHPAFDVTLLRHRGGIAGIEARLEWNRDRQSFDQTPLPGGVPAVAIGGAGQAVERRAA